MGEGKDVGEGRVGERGGVWEKREEEKIVRYIETEKLYIKSCNFNCKVFSLSYTANNLSTKIGCLSCSIVSSPASSDQPPAFCQYNEFIFAPQSANYTIAVHEYLPNNLFMYYQVVMYVVSSIAWQEEEMVLCGNHPPSQSDVNDEERQ